MNFSNILNDLHERMSEIYDLKPYKVRAEEISQLEGDLGLRLPSTYKEYLRVFGKGPNELEDSHGLLRIDSLKEYLKEIKEEIAEEGVGDVWAENSLVFRSIDGTEFYLIVCDCAENPPVFEGRYGKNGIEINNTEILLDRYLVDCIEDAILLRN